MGRKPNNPGAIPNFRTRVNDNGTVRYYYDHGWADGKRILEPLGNDRQAALVKWAEIEGLRTSAAVDVRPTFAALVTEYRKKELPAKALSTRRLYDIILTRLQGTLGERALDDIRPADVAQIWQVTAEKRGVVTANRTKAVLSLTLNQARLWGLMTQANPCAGIRGRKETGRKGVLVSDELYDAVYKHADQPLRNAMDLADLTSQRPGDLLAVRRTDISNGYLRFSQAKTGNVVVIEVTGELKKLVDALQAWRGSEVDVSPYLLRDEKGHPLTRGQLRSRFDNARDKAKIDKADFQFRDLRARSVTRKAIESGLEEAQRLAGHTTPGMTAHYSRGARPVKPSR
ncbi:integrase [Pandoraea pnomenusa]|uniref:Site-specific recombinase XerD n=1 Tax=Pandoraea pnomenusa TaxID=93220 RepID=A0A379KDD0_9BURK|nr:integrase [Pandoraea pnomenusa]SUA78287.1 Site-specific recombinase XerD [Pandoraea pnomenusa]SUD65889.1 Site-specific recombinase XerD [Pandoraea pnomenusa]